MPFMVVDESETECPYLPAKVACMPLRLPLAPLTPQEFDELLAEGDRRAGPFLYRTRCPACSACEALRIPVARFTPSKSQRRVARRNQGSVTMEFGAPQLTARHVELYNRHKTERGLSRHEEPTTAQGYRMHVLETCVETREVRYLVDGRLVAVSILDFGEKSCSSVYHYFDPDQEDRSLGVLSVLREIDLCRELGLDWYYLGLYVKDCRALTYKASYFPHQKLLAGEWQEFS